MQAFGCMNDTLTEEGWKASCLGIEELAMAWNIK